MRLTALQALELGWSVIPVKADKHPYFKWANYQASKPDKDMITRWHARYKPPAWAVVTGAISEVVVLDFDGEAGIATMATLGLEPHVRTGSGGYHVYVEHPGFEVKTLNSKSKQELGKLYPGLDIRADGGYAVFCGRNGTGNYRLLREPAPCPISSLPSDVRLYLGLETGSPEAETPTLMEATDDEDVIPADALLHEALEEAPAGRNDAGFRLACRLRDHGHSREDAEPIMRRFQTSVAPVNAKGIHEPYTLKEVHASLAEAFNETVTIVHKSGVRTRSKPGDEGATEDVAIRSAPWPQPLAAEAFHGLAGDFVRLVEPHTEADPAALLSSFIAAFGNVIGRTAHFLAEADRHCANLFVVQVGLTSKGRKGTSLGHIRRTFAQVDDNWDSDRVISGLSSGKGLIWAVRDPIEKQEPIRENKQVKGYQSVTVDQGVDDKRLLCIESEFASVLRVLGREGNTLSAVVRNAWDTGNLSALTKNSPGRATGAHISIIGHITKDELLRYLDSTEAGNGFGNRFLWVCVRRSKCLPEGGKLLDSVMLPIVERLGNAIRFSTTVEEMSRDTEARRLWRQEYPALSDGKPGLLGAMIARAEAQVMRLACVYALLDFSSAIREDHLKAALAVWRYAEESARFIFGDSLGDPVADDILKALSAASDGLTRTQISRHFGRNMSASSIGRALSTLSEHGLALAKQEHSGGRPAERWFATNARVQQNERQHERNELDEITGGQGQPAQPDIGLSSYDSYISLDDVGGDRAKPLLAESKDCENGTPPYNCGKCKKEVILIPSDSGSGWTYSCACGNHAKVACKDYDKLRAFHLAQVDDNKRGK